MRRGSVLNAIMASAGPHATLISHTEEPWHSATFSGARHTVQLSWQAPPGGKRVDIPPFWPPDNFEIPGKVVAEITVNNSVVEMVPRLSVTAEVGMLILERA